MTIIKMATIFVAQLNVHICDKDHKMAKKLHCALIMFSLAL